MDTEDAEVGQLYGSAQPHPVRCSVVYDKTGLNARVWKTFPGVQQANLACLDICPVGHVTRYDVSYTPYT